MPDVRPSAGEVVAFWRDAGPKHWFAHDDAFDAAFRQRFLPAHEAAARGDLEDWLQDAEGALALLILLDQFPRNAFRGSARAFATDGQARDVAARAVERGLDTLLETPLRQFFYMPFMHSEALADQQRGVALCEQVDADTLKFARLHRDTIARFGRFPHRNAVLGRSTTAAEQAFLDAGGFKG